jgi:hypothetical protein
LKEILDVMVVGGFIYLLFVFLRGMNETQVKKHQDKLDKIDKMNAEKTKKEESV